MLACMLCKCSLYCLTPTLPTLLIRATLQSEDSTVWKVSLCVVLDSPEYVTNTPNCTHSCWAAQIAAVAAGGIPTPKSTHLHRRKPYSNKTRSIESRQHCTLFLHQVNAPRTLTDDTWYEEHT